MCEHEDELGGREAAMVWLGEGEPPRSPSKAGFADPCIAPLVRALNASGLGTIASCLGHGRHFGTVMLADGRELVVVPDRVERDRLYGSATGSRLSTHEGCTRCPNGQEVSRG